MLFFRQLFFRWHSTERLDTLYVEIDKEIKYQNQYKTIEESCFVISKLYKWQNKIVRVLNCRDNWNDNMTSFKKEEEWNQSEEQGKEIDKVMYGN